MWSKITDDYISLQAIRGVKPPLIGRPPVTCPSNTELDERRVDLVIDEAIKVVVFSGFSVNFTYLSQHRSCYT